MDLVKFMSVNNLTQGEITQYLGVNKSTVSRLVSGEIKVSDEIYDRLVNNDMGWDVSSLMGSHEGGARRKLPYWKEKMYEDMIRERDERILNLQERLYKLMYKKDE